MSDVYWHAVRHSRKEDVSVVERRPRVQSQLDMCLVLRIGVGHSMVHGAMCTLLIG
jgi:hypothetical protein